MGLTSVTPWFHLPIGCNFKKNDIGNIPLNIHLTLTKPKSPNLLVCCYKVPLSVGSVWVHNESKRENSPGCVWDSVQHEERPHPLLVLHTVWTDLRAVQTAALISPWCDFQLVTAGWSALLLFTPSYMTTQSNSVIKLKREADSRGQCSHRLPSLAASQWCSAVTTSVLTVWQLCSSFLSAHVNVVK